MKDVNKVLLIGRLGADPVEKPTRSGVFRVSFPLATSRRVRVSAPGAQGRQAGARTGRSREALAHQDLEGPEDLDRQDLEDDVDAADSHTVGQLAGEAQVIRASERERPGEADYSDETQWHRVVAWGKEAQQCLQFLKKGNAVFVEGAIRSRKFTGKDGTDRYWFEVHAESVNFLGGKPAPVPVL
jgi:single-stranded DNA-binding protein